MNDRDARIEAAIAEYLAACDAGVPLDRASFVEKYPDLADSLNEFLADHERMKCAAGSDVTASLPSPSPTPDSPTITASEGSPAAKSPIGRIRYFGDYELFEEIARGGMGIVFKARQLSLNRVVALKMILAGQLASDAEVKRFHAEAQAAANLDHPNILPVYEVGVHEGQHYFSMKLVEGDSLANRIAPLVKAPRSAASLLEAVARGVHFAHQRGIMHRDLKPANILLDADGTPFISDFGLAKKSEGSSSLTQSGAIVGTPSYMAPEQARGSRSISTAVDTYALGAILYELLTGQPPFKGDSVAQTLRLVEDSEPAAPTTLNERCNRELAAVAMKCLEKDPARRYESAAAFAEELARWLRGEPVMARPTGAAGRAFKWLKRNPVVAGLSAALAAAMIIGSLFSISYAMKSKQSENLAKDRMDMAINSDLASRQSEEAANDALCRSSFEQARALRLARQPGWRDKALELLKQAGRLNQRERKSTESSSKLPPLHSIRGEVLNALLGSDATILNKIPVGLLEWIAISGNGRRIVIDGRDNDSKCLMVIDVDTGREVSQVNYDLTPDLPDPGVFFAANFDGTQIAAVYGVGIKVTDVMTGRAVAHCENPKPLGKTDGYVSAPVFSPDGRRIAVIRIAGGLYQVVVWQLSAPNTPVIVDFDKPEPKHFENQSNEARSSWNQAIRFSPDSQRIGVIGVSRRTVKAFDLARNPPMQTMEIKPKQEVEQFEWSSDGKYGAILTGEKAKRYRVQFWDLAKNEPYAVSASDFAVPPLIAYSPDGLHVAAITVESSIQVLSAINGATEISITVPKFRRSNTLLAWTIEGQLVSYAEAQNMARWKLSYGDNVARKYRGIGFSDRTSFSPDGSWIASYRGGMDNDKLQDPRPSEEPMAPKKKDAGKFAKSVDRLDIFDRKTGRLWKTIDGDVGLAGSVQFSHDGKQIATVHRNEIVVRDFASGNVAYRRKAVAPFAGAGFFYALFGSNNRLYVVTTTEEETTILWDVEASRQVVKFDSPAVKPPSGIVISSLDGSHVLFDPQGQFALFDGRQSMPALYEIPSGNRVGEVPLLGGKNQLTLPLGIASDNRTILSGSITMDKKHGRDLLKDSEWVVHRGPSFEEICRGDANGNVIARCFGKNPDQVLMPTNDSSAELWQLSNKAIALRWTFSQDQSTSFIGFTSDEAIVVITDNGESMTVIDMIAFRKYLAAISLDW